MSFINNLEKLICKQRDSKIMFIHILGIYGDQSTTILKTIISGMVDLLQSSMVAGILFSICDHFADLPTKYNK